MNTRGIVAAERSTVFVIFTALAELANGLLGFPFDPFQAAALAFLFSSATSLFGYGVGRGLSRTKFAAAEEYGEAAAAFKKTLEKESK